MLKQLRNVQPRWNGPAKLFSNFEYELDGLGNPLSMATIDLTARLSNYQWWFLITLFADGQSFLEYSESESSVSTVAKTIGKIKISSQY